MKSNTYKFRYSNFSSRAVKGILSVVSNFGAPILFAYLLLIIMALCGVLKYLTIEMCFAFLGVSVVVGIISAMIYSFGYKGVVLYNDCLKISTKSISVRKPLIKIAYSEIISVYNSTFDLRHDRRKIRNSFLVGDYSDYVEITLRGGKQFCFSVENQQEFVDELICRINKLNIQNEKLN